MAETTETDRETGKAPLSGSVEIPGTKKKIPKKAAFAAAALLAVFGVMWLRQRNAGAATAGQVTDPAGNVCAAVNPATGYCPGTDADNAASAGTSGETFGQGTAGLQGGGGVIGYDSNGNPIYGNTTTNQVATGPPFVSNAAWSQYAVSVLTSLDQTALTNALGAYITGAQVTPAQRVLIDDAISVAGKPPETGPNGFPPSINVGGSSSGGGTVVVPKLVGAPLQAAREALRAEGLHATVSPDPKADHSYKVTRQSPTNGKRVAAGSSVHLTIEQTGGAPKGSRKLPSVVGKHVDAALAELKAAGFGNVTLSQKRQPGRVYTVDKMAPGAGRFANTGTAVHLTISPAMHPGH